MKSYSTTNDKKKHFWCHGNLWIICCGESTFMEEAKSKNKLRDGLNKELSESLFMWTNKRSPGINFNNIWCCNQQRGDEGEKDLKSEKPGKSLENSSTYNLANYTRGRKKSAAFGNSFSDTFPFENALWSKFYSNLTRIWFIYKLLRWQWVQGKIGR